MYDKTFKIATRRSRLAIWQADYVRNELLKYHPNLKIELMPMITVGDIMLNPVIKNNSRKGLFIKELEHALLNHSADIAVHSMKDVTSAFPDGLGLVVLCKRGDPRDAFVSIHYPNIDALPDGAVIGTSSLRRQCQLHEHRPDLLMQNLRGNIDSRLKKLNYGKYDALILAMAGLQRLSLDQYIRAAIDPSDLLPAMGQGAIGIECRLDDDYTISLLKPLHHQKTALRVNAERAINTHLKANCQLPIASYAEIENNQLWLRALIASPDGTNIIRSEGRSPLKQAKNLGLILAKDLISRSMYYTTLLN